MVDTDPTRRLDKVLENHADLWDLFRRIPEQFLTLRTSPRSVRFLLLELQENLLKHFQHEEQEDFVGRTQEHAPHLVDSLEKLAKEHELLRGRLSQLLRECEVESWDEGNREQVAHGFERFADAFARHESDEQTLLNEAYNLDIGNKD